MIVHLFFLMASPTASRVPPLVSPFLCLSRTDGAANVPPPWPHMRHVMVIAARQPLQVSFARDSPQLTPAACGLTRIRRTRRSREGASQVRRWAWPHTYSPASRRPRTHTHHTLDSAYGHPRRMCGHMIHNHTSFTSLRRRDGGSMLLASARPGAGRAIPCSPGGLM